MPKTLNSWKFLAEIGRRPRPVQHDMMHAFVYSKYEFAVTRRMLRVLIVLLVGCAHRNLLKNWRRVKCAVGPMAKALLSHICFCLSQNGSTLSCASLFLYKTLECGLKNGRFISIQFFIRRLTFHASNKPCSSAFNFRLPPLSARASVYRSAIFSQRFSPFMWLYLLFRVDSSGYEFEHRWIVRGEMRKQ